MRHWRMLGKDNLSLICQYTADAVKSVDPMDPYFLMGFHPKPRIGSNIRSGFLSLRGITKTQFRSTIIKIMQEEEVSYGA